MATADEIRRRVRLALILRATGDWSRHPHPGQRYTHGWKPTAVGLAAEAVKAMSDKELIETFHDPELETNGDKYSDEFIDALVQEVGERAGSGEQFERWLATERRVLANQRRREASKGRHERERDRRIDELVAAGATPEQAWDEVVNRGAGPKQRAWDIVGRRAGESYEQALRRGYAEAVERELAESEDVVIGYFLSPEGKKQVAAAEAQARRRKRIYQFNPADLWSMSQAKAEAWASRELQDFWESRGGRLTFARWRSQVER